MEEPGKELHALWAALMEQATGEIVVPWEGLDGGQKLAWNSFADKVEIYDSEDTELSL
jgi:hypothetical protein